MNRRLRKKTRRGEFAVYGVNLRFRVAEMRPSSLYGDEEVDALIAFAETNNLAVGGGLDPDDRIGRFFVTAVRPYKRRMRHGGLWRTVSVTASDRAALEAHLAYRAPHVTDVRVGSLVDANHGPFHDDTDTPP